MSGQSAPVGNQLLALLSQDSLASVMQKLTPVPLQLREEILRAGGQITSACFPQSGMISLVALLDGGMQAESAARACLECLSPLASTRPLVNLSCSCQGPR